MSLVKTTENLQPIDQFPGKLYPILEPNSLTFISNPGSLPPLPPPPPLPRGEETLVMISLVLILAVFLRRKKEFYSANGAYVLVNEDATKCFYSVNPTTKQHSAP